MAPVTCTIEPDELLGLSALVELDRTAAGGGTCAGTCTCTCTCTCTAPAPAPTRYEPRKR